jgi:hypothetical protein
MSGCEQLITSLIMLNLFDDANISSDKSVVIQNSGTNPMPLVVINIG